MMQCSNCLRQILPCFLQSDALALVPEQAGTQDAISKRPANRTEHRVDTEPCQA